MQRVQRVPLIAAERDLERLDSKALENLRNVGVLLKPLVKSSVQTKVSRLFAAKCSRLLRSSIGQGRLLWRVSQIRWLG